MRFALRWVAVGLAALLGACAHPISIAPNPASLSAATDAPVVPLNVAYVITTVDRDREVTTGGGGGDSVRYFPYRELESGIFQALSAVFSRVTLLRSAAEKQAPANRDLSLIFVPVITTASSSSSIVTWPPTSFFITLSYAVQDADGKQVYSNQVLGRGAAEFEEFVSNFGLAGKRAAEDALLKFKQQVAGAKELQ